MDVAGDWARAVEDIYCRASCRSEEVEGVGWLALRVLGSDCLKYAPASQPEPVRLIPGDSWTISISDQLDDNELTMAIARALALWWLAQWSDVAPPASDVAGLAVAIAVPMDRLETEIDRGSDIARLAAAFVVPVAVIRDRVRTPPRTVRSGVFMRLVAS